MIYTQAVSNLLVQIKEFLSVNGHHLFWSPKSSILSSSIWKYEKKKLNTLQVMFYYNKYNANNIYILLQDYFTFKQNKMG